MTQMDLVAGLLLTSGAFADAADKVNKTVGPLEVDTIFAYGDGTVHMSLLSGIEAIAEHFGVEIYRLGKTDYIDVLEVRITQWRGEENETV